MHRNPIIRLCPIGLLLISFPLLLTATNPPSKASLIAAWEELQRNDPQTEIFEKIEDSLYRFKTTQFPFDGNLRMLNASIETNSFYEDEQSIIGFVEVELVDTPEDFREKFSQSYSYWLQKNTLYFDVSTQRWLSGKAWQEQFRDRYRQTWWQYGSTFFWLGLFIIIIGYVAVASRNAAKQMKVAMKNQDTILADHKRAVALTEKALTLEEESAQILRDILAELKRQNDQRA